MSNGEKHISSQAYPTLAGFAAIVMWAMLALLTDMTGDIPPFQLAAMTFTIGAIVGVAWHSKTPRHEKLRPSTKVLAAGALGLFAYHALYFTALKNAPAVEASLIAYLWPLLIVVGSALLPGEKLRWFHIAGALAGFAGTAFIVTGGTSFSLKAEYGFGYLVALLAAFTWATYSLGARRIADVPTSAVTVYCAGAAILALLAHIGLETTQWSISAVQWAAIIGLGTLPVGAAFYLWDVGMKRGNIQVIGTSSYAAPLLSTIILVVAGRAELTLGVGAACLLITAGALLAAKDVLTRRSRP